MPFCPFTREECSPDCIMYAKVADQCGFLYQGILLEEIHDMIVEFHDSIREKPEESIQNKARTKY